MERILGESKPKSWLSSQPIVRGRNRENSLWNFIPSIDWIEHSHTETIRRFIRSYSITVTHSHHNKQERFQNHEHTAQMDLLQIHAVERGSLSQLKANIQLSGHLHHREHRVFCAWSRVETPWELGRVRLVFEWQPTTSSLMATGFCRFQNVNSAILAHTHAADHCACYRTKLCW